MGFAGGGAINTLCPGEKFTLVLSQSQSVYSPAVPAGLGKVNSLFSSCLNFKKYTFQKKDDSAMNIEGKLWRGLHRAGGNGG